MCMGSNLTAKGYNFKINNEMKKFFVASPCTLIITGNLHRKKTNCFSGLGCCLIFKIDIDWSKIINELLPREDAKKARAVVTIDPKLPDQVIVNFLDLDEEQMQVNTWDLEEDLVIDDPDLVKEPGGYKSITLLKGNYEIDRSENEVGRCVLQCKVN